ncbi:VP1/VP2 [Rousettus leschenaultii bocaparvovirus 1]|uniref:Minor capsid protein VP1 n=2 Tax=Parvoviridae TaxID=10780 RepID=A0A2H4N9S6_9VIRU|nr:VP1/VP2 [Rousettus leschenaultii bocaparvovirus 1]ATV81499.1 VP1/VP2 [Rousettus leschenaultii bocaparvovirus 1]
MAPVNRKPAGWVVPGYKYLGPFNDLDKGEPVNAADRAAQVHDHAYNKYLQSGKNPYLHFNKADQQFLDDLESDRSFGGWIGKTVFGIKRAIAPSLNEPSPKKSKTEAALKRKLYFARSAKASKQAKMEPAADSTNNQQNQPNQPAPANTGSSAGQTNAGGGSGGHGVGVSTGGWEGGTWFGDDTIVTTVTRQWYTGILNGHKYSLLKQNIASGVPNIWTGIQTPWAYFNFNCYHSHFSPGDWQRLINEYKSWRPKRMHVKIYNLQIKQVVILGTDTLYNNDLTAGVHIMCDGSHQYPYAQHPWDELTLPELPYNVWQLPQYAYFQRQGDLVDDTNHADLGNIENIIRVGAPLFMLENSNHQVLRTGEATEVNFSFDCGWVHNDRAYCAPQQDFNPMVASRRYYASWSNANNKYMFDRYSPYKKPSNWMPGPSIHLHGATQTANFPQDARGPVITVFAPRGTVGRGGASSTVPGTTGDYLASAEGILQAGFSTSPVNGACSRSHYPSLACDATEGANNETFLSARNIHIDVTRYNAVYGANRTATDNTYHKYNEVWMFPNQAWNSTPICRDNPIWDKLPRTDKHTLLDSSYGTLPMAHPPGTIYVKVAKIPIPGAAGADSYLNLYVTGQVTCEIEWEVERYQTKNWRPEVRQSASSFVNKDLYNVSETGVYSRANTFNECMPTKCGINRVL